MADNTNTNTNNSTTLSTTWDDDHTLTWPGCRLPAGRGQKGQKAKTMHGEEVFRGSKRPLRIIRGSGSLKCQVFFFSPSTNLSWPTITPRQTPAQTTSVVLGRCARSACARLQRGASVQARPHSPSTREAHSSSSDTRTNTNGRSRHQTL